MTGGWPCGSRQVEVLGRCGRVAWMLVFAAGCAHGGTLRRQGAPEGNRVEMEELRIAATQSESGEFVVQVYDAKHLFEDGLDTHAEGQLEEAAARFDRVSREFGASAYHAPALYNAGLVYRALGREREAIARFTALIERHPESADVAAARLLLLALYEAISEHEHIEELAQALLETPLEEGVRLEVLVRQCRSRVMLHTGASAASCEALLSHMLAERATAPGSDLPRRWVGAAYRLLGDAAWRRVQATSLQDAAGISIGDRPDASDRIAQALMARANAILGAQVPYLRAMYLGDPKESPYIAGLVARMYEGFWNDVMALPLPSPPVSLDGEELAVFQDTYRLELAKHLVPVLARARTAWEHALNLAAETGLSSAGQSHFQAQIAALTRFVASVEAAQEAADLPASMTLPEAASRTRGGPDIEQP